jgi:hypothetical protein
VDHGAFQLYVSMLQVVVHRPRYVYRIPPVSDPTLSIILSTILSTILSSVHPPVTIATRPYGPSIHHTFLYRLDYHVVSTRRSGQRVHEYMRIQYRQRYSIK